MTDGAQPCVVVVRSERGATIEAEHQCRLADLLLHFRTPHRAGDAKFGRDEASGGGVTDGTFPGQSTHQGTGLVERQATVMEHAERSEHGGVQEQERGSGRRHGAAGERAARARAMIDVRWRRGATATLRGRVVARPTGEYCAESRSLP